MYNYYATTAGRCLQGMLPADYFLSAQLGRCGVATSKDDKPQQNYQVESQKYQVKYQTDLFY